MTYRDDLEAAHARIAALEAELDRRRAKPGAPRVGIAPEDLPTTPTLFDHNRAHPPLMDGDPAGVRCPQCALADDHVEMRVGLVNAEYAADHVAVACPRCLFSSHRRLRPGESFVPAELAADLAELDGAG